MPGETSLPQPPTSRQPAETTGLYLGLLFGAAQAFSGIIQYPADYKIPALMIMVLLCACIMSYFRRGVGSLAFRISLGGALIGIFVCAYPSMEAAAKGFFLDLISDRPQTYYVTVTVFSDDNGNGVKDAFERPIGNIKIEIRERDDRIGMRGIFPKETDENGIAQIALPRAGQATVHVCHISEQHTIREDATSPARTEQIVVGIPPALVNTCDRP